MTGDVTSVRTDAWRDNTGRAGRTLRDREAGRLFAVVAFFAAERPRLLGAGFFGGSGSSPAPAPTAPASGEGERSGDEFSESDMFQSGRQRIMNN